MNYKIWTSAWIVVGMQMVNGLQVSAQTKGEKFDPNYNGYYLLKTQYTGDGQALEGNDIKSPTMNGAAFMSSQAGSPTGQQWKFVADPSNPGYYRLKTRLHGDGKCLEGNGKDSPVKGGASFMDDCKNVSGQLWKVENLNNGYYRLRAKSQGETTSLEARVDGMHGNNTFLDNTRNVTGQFWYLVKVGATTSSKNTLNSGEILKVNERLTSANNAYILVMQADGNLCIYKFENGKQGAFVWGSMKHGFSNGRVQLQADGNLVVSNDKNEAQWSSQTHPFFDAKFKDAQNKPTKLVLENDGKINLYAGNKVVWTNK